MLTSKNAKDPNIKVPQKAMLMLCQRIILCFSWMKVVQSRVPTGMLRMRGVSRAIRGNPPCSRSQTSLRLVLVNRFLDLISFWRYPSSQNSL